MHRELEIKLTGLTKQDTVLCDLLWSDATARSAAEIIQDLPEQYRARAWCLHDLIMAEVIDQMVEAGGEDSERVILRARG